MTFKIPPSQRHQQLNKNDLGGTIYQSRNISLDEEGYIKLSDASYAVITEDDDVDFDVADAMYPMESDLYVNASEVFRGDVGFDTFSNRSTDTNAPSPGPEGDSIFFNDTEVVTDSTLIKYRSAATTWTSVSLSFSSADPMVMCVWDAENSLAVGNGNTVKFVSTAWAVNGTSLTVPAQYQISSLQSRGSSLYIFTKNISGGEAKVFIVGAIQALPDSVYGCGAFEIFASTPFKDSIAIITSLGQLLRFNGGGFTELATLPIYATNIEWADALNDYSVVSNRALVSDGDLLYINLSSETENGRYRTLPNFPSGVWCYDDTNKSLYHRHGVSYTRIQSISGSAVTVDITDNDFTLTSENLDNVVTGMPVHYSDKGGTSIPELLESVTYYIIKDSSTVFRLADSYTNAILGTALNVSGVGSVSQRFYIFKTNDYGSVFIGNRMSLAVLNNRHFNDAIAGRLAIAAELRTKQSIGTEVTALNGISPYLPNRGYFITPRLESSNIEDTFQKLYIKHKALNIDDKIIVKYKVKDTLRFPFSCLEFVINATRAGTWTSTSTFTTTVDMSEVEVGDEIELIAGVGSGHMAHVTTIAEAGGTYTVTLGEAFPFAVSGDQFFFNVDKWIYLGEVTSDEVNQGRKQFDLGFPSEWVQFKVELRGIGVTINQLLVENARLQKPL